MTYDSELDLKRIQSLTDASFAVAMTILILEVKIPPGLHRPELNHHFFFTAIPELFIYGIGFITLGIFWIGSHYHHHHLLKTDRVSSWLNILFLMLICIIPFSIGFLRNYVHEPLSIIFYSINLILASAINYGMLVYAWRKKYTRPHFTTADFYHARHRILIPIYIYASIIPVSFAWPAMSLYLFLVPFLLHIIPERGNRAAAKKETEAGGGSHEPGGGRPEP